MRVRSSLALLLLWWGACAAQTVVPLQLEDVCSRSARAGRASGWLGRAQRLVELHAKTASSGATCCCRPVSGT